MGGAVPTKKWGGSWEHSDRRSQSSASRTEATPRTARPPGRDRRGRSAEHPGGGMTPTDVIEILGTANPLPRGVAAALPLSAGESELLRGIVADRSGTTVRAVRVHRRVRRKFSLGLAVAVAAV